MSGKGTPATKAVDAAKVAHTLHEYSHEAAATSYGGEAAEALGIEPARIHKTLLAAVERAGRSELGVAVVPVDGQLDLKALATAVGAKKAEMATPVDAERTTGYVVGGISPLGQRKRLTTVIDDGATVFPTVFVSAGRRGLEIELTAADLAALTGATFAPIAKRASRAEHGHRQCHDAIGVAGAKPPSPSPADRINLPADQNTGGAPDDSAPPQR